MLAARAETRGQSLQQFLTSVLTQMASQPTLTELFAEIESGPPRPRIDPDDIVRAIHEDREGR